MVNPNDWFSRDVAHLISIVSISHFNVNLQIALIAFYAYTKRQRNLVQRFCLPVTHH